jgi:hypothetical protein
MLVKRNAQELGDDIDAIDSAVQTITDRDVDQPILGCQRDGRFSTNFGQRIETSTPTAAENQ